MARLLWKFLLKTLAGTLIWVAEQSSHVSVTNTVAGEALAPHPWTMKLLLS